jgi:hypothetical protein
VVAWQQLFFSFYFSVFDRPRYTRVLLIAPFFFVSYLKCFSMALDFSLPPPKTLNINVMSMYRLTTLKNNLSVSYFIYFRR